MRREIIKKPQKPVRKELEKNLSEKFVWAIAYGSSIGWGAFILPGDWIKSAGPIGATVGILLGALLMIVIAVSYGALVEKFPVSGGAFAFGYLGFGKYIAFFFELVFNFWIYMYCRIKCISF